MKGKNQLKNRNNYVYHEIYDIKGKKELSPKDFEIIEDLVEIHEIKDIKYSNQEEIMQNNYNSQTYDVDMNKNINYEEEFRIYLEGERIPKNNYNTYTQKVQRNMNNLEEIKLNQKNWSEKFENIKFQPCLNRELNNKQEEKNENINQTLNNQYKTEEYNNEVLYNEYQKEENKNNNGVLCGECQKEENILCGDCQKEENQKQVLCGDCQKEENQNNGILCGQCQKEETKNNEILCNECQKEENQNIKGELRDECQKEVAQNTNEVLSNECKNVENQNKEEKLEDECNKDEQKNEEESIEYKNDDESKPVNIGFVDAPFLNNKEDKILNEEERNNLIETLLTHIKSDEELNNNLVLTFKVIEDNDKKIIIEEIKKKIESDEHEKKLNNFLYMVE